MVYCVVARVWGWLSAVLSGLFGVGAVVGLFCAGARGEVVVRGDGVARGDWNVGGVAGVVVGVALLVEVPGFCLATRGV